MPKTSRKRNHLFVLFSDRRLSTSVFFFIVLVIIAIITAPFFRFFKNHGFKPSFLYDVTLAKTPPLKSLNGRTNILLLGMGGGNHEGTDLTDSLLVASINLENQTVGFIFLPRDIWSPTLRDKINSAYHYGEIKKKGGGLILAKSIAEEITGLPIHYGVVIDFNGFKTIVDALGGIDITVDRAFTDPKFPIQGKEQDTCGDQDPNYACRYKEIHFNKGLQHLDGTQTLEFVRSRNAKGAEGNDYARGQRQQKVLLALKNKVIRDKLYLNPTKVQELFEVLNNTVKTDMTTAEVIYFAKLMYGFNEDHIKRIPIVEGGENGEIKGFFVNPPLWKYDGRWVLTPPDEDFTAVHKYILCQLNNPHCDLKLPNSWN